MHHVKKTFVCTTHDVALGVTPVAAVTGSWFYSGDFTPVTHTCTQPFFPSLSPRVLLEIPFQLIVVCF